MIYLWNENVSWLLLTEPPGSRRHHCVRDHTNTNKHGARTANE